ncbi:MAG: cation:dicarboxylase symporter family transporter, partial [Pyramidobacter sp.]|nr:cation:dicarboxylase symporter family transporter [Pyramidobacter sp.]
MSSKGSKLFSMSAPMQIFCAMVIGSALGLFFPAQMKNLKFVGDIWLNCIKLIVIPMVLCVLTLAIGSQKSAASIGRVARRILIFY